MFGVGKAKTQRPAIRHQIRPQRAYPIHPDLLVALPATAFRAAAAARKPDKLSRLDAAAPSFLGGTVAPA